MTTSDNQWQQSQEAAEEARLAALAELNLEEIDQDWAVDSSAFGDVELGHSVDALFISFHISFGVCSSFYAT